MFKLTCQTQQATGFRFKILFKRTKNKNLRSNETQKHGSTVDITIITKQEESTDRTQVTF